MVNSIGDCDVHDVKDPTHQYDIDNKQDKNERRVQKKILESLSLSPHQRFHPDLLLG